MPINLSYVKITCKKCGESFKTWTTDANKIEYVCAACKFKHGGKSK